MKTLYSAVYDGVYPFEKLVDGEVNQQVVTDPAEMMSFNAALILWGGADISPSLYNHPTSRRCYPGSTRRDFVEWNLLKEAIEMGIPIIGVCRGAQMLCAAAGGYLLQDVNNHAGPGHNVETWDGKKFRTNSIHHQMMAGLDKVNHRLLAWAEKNVGAPYTYMNDQMYVPSMGWKEPEFVYFPDIRGFAIQWHPEMMVHDCAATEYVIDYIKKTISEESKTRAPLALVQD